MQMTLTSFPLCSLKIGPMAYGKRMRSGVENHLPVEFPQVGKFEGQRLCPPFLIVNRSKILFC